MKDETFSAELAETALRMAEIFQKEDDFVLICHIAPDGDAMGSALALLMTLEGMGKRVYAVCDGKAAHGIARVLPVDRIAVYEDGKQHQAKIAIALDCADWQRMGGAAALFDGARHKLVIDHHMSNPGFGDLNLVDSGAAATAEILLSLFEEMDLALNKDVASCLYVALNTDTGGFAYSNTTGDTLRAAARLLETGIDFANLRSELFRVRSATKSRMLGKVLSDFTLHCGGCYALAALNYQQLSALNALAEDSEGLVENLRDVEGVEVAVYIRENAKDVYKASMRSRNYVDVARICQKQGGGGHIRAAGFTWNGKLEQLQDWLLSEVEQAVNGKG